MSSILVFRATMRLCPVLISIETLWTSGCSSSQVIFVEMDRLWNLHISINTLQFMETVYRLFLTSFRCV
ncbi:unnamed protein product [Musa acuminata subsp. burmannicoides]